MTYCAALRFSAAAQAVVVAAEPVATDLRQDAPAAVAGVAAVLCISPHVLFRVVRQRQQELSLQEVETVAMVRRREQTLAAVAAAPVAVVVGFISYMPLSRGQQQQTA